MDRCLRGKAGEGGNAKPGVAYVSGAIRQVFAVQPVAAWERRQQQPNLG